MDTVSRRVEFSGDGGITGVPPLSLGSQWEPKWGDVFSFSFVVHFE